MALIEFRGLAKRYGRKEVLRGLDLGIEAGRFTVLCGPSQCGKSTLLRMLVGLETPDAGEVRIAGADVTALPAARRRIGYVPQSFALYPHMSVFDNIAYPLRLEGGVGAVEMKERVERAAGLVNVIRLLDKTPDKLSGGEKQRTAVARGLMKSAEIFVLDDPLVGLDFKLRERLMDDLMSLRDELGAAFVYATSDSLEALALAQDLVVLDEGLAVEKAGVETLYHEPKRRRSFELIGSPRPNLIPGAVDDRGLCVTAHFAVTTAVPGPGGRRVVLGLRPEDLCPEGSRHGAADGETLVVEAVVRLVEDLGAERVIYLEADGATLVMTQAADDALAPADGERLRLGVEPERLLVFDAETGERLGRGRASAARAEVLRA